MILSFCHTQVEAQPLREIYKSQHVTTLFLIIKTSIEAKVSFHRMVLHLFCMVSEPCMFRVKGQWSWFVIEEFGLCMFAFSIICHPSLDVCVKLSKQYNFLMETLYALFYYTVQTKSYTLFCCILFCSILLHSVLFCLGLVILPKIKIKTALKIIYFIIFVVNNSDST